MQIPNDLLRDLPASVHPLLSRASIATTPENDRSWTDILPAVGPGQASTSDDVIRDAANRLADECHCSSQQRTTLAAGLLLLHDHLDASHKLSQTLEGRGNPRTADYWHGIMHRREPDAANAAYWFRRVGNHPALQELGKDLREWLVEMAVPQDVQSRAMRLVDASGAFDPFAMIDLSTAALRAPESVDEQTARVVQYLEMLNLLQWSFGHEAAR